ncbi:MAG: carboxypeptidase regulatory-like domain-containing protein [Acidobacteriota bacterium]
MTGFRTLTLLVFLSAATLLVPASAHAQSNSGIAGVVRDSSGAVLPGVTVEAASPALIEKVRTAVTDGAGQFKIVELRPGSYTLTFTLAGFSSVKREGVELTASFTATVNADLRVGAVEETITVSGATPTVDLQNVVQQQVMTRDIINAVPAGTKSAMVLGVLIPGVTTISQDVGGTIYGSAAIAIHNSRAQEMQLLHDGMAYNNGQGRGGSFTAIATNDATVAEVSLETSGLSAESEVSGIRSNVIPKDGGNSFKGYFFGTYTDDHMQSNNLSDELKQRGLATVDQVKRIFDIDPALGGPIKKDTLWFFGSVRVWKTEQTIAGMFYNLNPPGSPSYTPDLSRPAFEGDRDGNQSLRLTWRVSTKHKITAQQQVNQQIRDHFYGQGAANRLLAPDAIMYYNARPSYLSQAGWTAPMTSRLLFEGGVSLANKDFHYYPQPDVGYDAASWTENTTGIRWGNIPNGGGFNASHNWNARLVTSYVTGSHAAKFGVNFLHASSFITTEVSNNGQSYTLQNGLPRSVTVWATPISRYDVGKANVGLFAQDQWTVKRATLNAGLRFDYYNAYAPAQHLGPGPQVPTRNVDFPAVYDIPHWKNLSPRLGIAFDLLGNGKTAVKASIGRYLQADNLTTITGRANPAAAIVTSASRVWNDANNDFIPQSTELAAFNQSTFGQSVITSRYDDEVLAKRGFNWETSASIQHQLAPRVSMTAGYFRRWYGNFIVTDNILVTPADYTPFCVAAPADARLPGGGGYPVCGLYDISFAQFGQSNNVVKLANGFGEQREVYNGVDLSLNARLPRGLVISGGTSTGRVMTDSCFAIDSPQRLLNCRTVQPFQTQVKLILVYPLPWWGLQTAATVQSLPGPEITASYSAGFAEIFPTLGRNLASCGAAATVCNGTATVPLLPPGTYYGDRLNQVDLRMSKSVQLPGSRRVQALVDLYNLFNANPVLAQNNNFGPQWQRPTQILQGRLLKFGVQVDF